MKELSVIALVRLSFCAAVAVLTAAPSLFAQQRSSVLHGVPADTGSAKPIALFPLPIVRATHAPAEAGRYQILTHRIDSISGLVARLQSPTTLRYDIAQTSSRLLLVSQLTRNFGLFNDAPPGAARSPAAYAPMDWVSLVTLAGVAGLGRSSLLASDESDQTVWESLRNAGQWAGMTAAAGGASWLLSNFARHSVCLGRLACHRPPVDTRHR